MGQRIVGKDEKSHGELKRDKMLLPGSLKPKRIKAAALQVQFMPRVPWWPS